MSRQCEYPHEDDQHDHPLGPLIERAHALIDLANRHYEPATRHIGKDDYDLLIQIAEDLHHADFIMGEVHRFGSLLHTLAPQPMAIMMQPFGGGREHPTS